MEQLAQGPGPALQESALQREQTACRELQHEVAVLRYAGDKYDLADVPSLGLPCASSTLHVLPRAA